MGLVVAVGLASVISVATVLESVAAVGAVLSVVGQVTKNKTLSMVGLGLGVVGGVGALAAGALGVAGAGLAASDAATTAAGDAAVVSDVGSAAASGGVETGAFSVEGAATGAGAAASDAVPDVVGAMSASGAAADPAASIAGAVPEGAAMAPQDAAALQSSTEAAQAGGTSQTGLALGDNPIAPPTGAEATANPIQLPPGGLEANAPGQTALPAAPPGTTGTSSVPGTWGSPETNPDFQAGNAAGTTATNAYTDTSTSGLGKALSGFGSFIHDNPLLAYGMLQAGGSFLAGSTSTLTPAQVSALDAQAAANNAATAMSNQQRVTMAMPKAVASSSPVTGTPQTLVPGGFINAAPKQPAITGAPA